MIINTCQKLGLGDVIIEGVFTWSNQGFIPRVNSVMIRPRVDGRQEFRQRKRVVPVVVLNKASRNGIRCAHTVRLKNQFIDFVLVINYFLFYKYTFCILISYCADY